MLFIPFTYLFVVTESKSAVAIARETASLTASLTQQLNNVTSLSWYYGRCIYSVDADEYELVEINVVMLNKHKNVCVSLKFVLGDQKLGGLGDASHHITTDNNTSVLTIKDLSVSSEGLYLCRYEFDNGQSVNVSAYADVICEYDLLASLDLL